MNALHNVVNFTDAKRNLVSLLDQVAATSEPVFIELNGETVAVFSIKPPRSERVVPPLEITTDEARNDWSGLLAAVRIEGAYFGLRSKKYRDRVIHLRRYKEYRNEFSKRWLEHCRPYFQQGAHDKKITPGEVHALQEDMNQTLMGIRSELATDLGKLDEKMRLLFALVNRSGDIYKWEPLRSASDFSQTTDDD